MPFTLTEEALNAMLDQLPLLAGRPSRLEDLSGGLTNRNVKVTTADGVYVARCADTGRTCSASTATASTTTARAAEQAGVGAPVSTTAPISGCC